jgi:hypothetical protein
VILIFKTLQNSILKQKTLMLDDETQSILNFKKASLKKPRQPTKPFF